MTSDRYLKDVLFKARWCVDNGEWSVNMTPFECAAIIDAVAFAKAKGYPEVSSEAPVASDGLTARRGWPWKGIFESGDDETRVGWV